MAGEAAAGLPGARIAFGLDPAPQGARKLCNGSVAHGSWQLEHPVFAMVGWCLVIVAVCVPLALRRFSKMTAM